MLRTFDWTWSKHAMKQQVHPEPVSHHLQMAQIWLFGGMFFLDSCQRAREARLLAAAIRGIEEGRAREIEGAEAFERIRLLAERGLTRRSGRSLTPAERGIFATLATLDFGDLTHSVCKGYGCGVVFQPRRRGAQTCPACHRSPIRRPVGRGIPTVVRVGNLSEPGSRSAAILVECAECGREFWAQTAAARYCGACNSGAARMRRHRKDGAARGAAGEST